MEEIWSVVGGVDRQGNCRSGLAITEWDLTFLIYIHASTTHHRAMYGFTNYNEPPSTPTRSSRPLTTHTPSRPQPTPSTPRSSVTTAYTGAGSGLGDLGNGDPALVTYTTISQEYASLRYPGHCPLGMYLIPDANDMFVWDGVFFVHQGLSPICKILLVSLDDERADVPLTLHPPPSTAHVCS